MSSEPQNGQTPSVVPQSIPPPPAPGSSTAGPAATGQPGGPPPNIQQLVASKRLQQAQAQVGEVVDIMRVNVEKVRMGFQFERKVRKDMPQL